MSQVQAELARLQDEARRTLATIVAEQILGAEAQLEKVYADGTRLRAEIDSLRKLDITDKEAVTKQLGCEFRPTMFQLDDRTINLRDLLTRI